MFSVAATNYVGLGAFTADIAVVAAQAPSQATGVVRASFDSQTQIKLSWSPPADDGGSLETIDYEVYSDDGDQSLNSEYYLVSSSTGG